MGNASFPFLTVLVLLPVAGAAVVAVVPPRVVPSWFYQYVGAMVGLGTLAVAVAVAVEFKTGDGGYQLVSDHSWANQLGIHWSLGVDGISLFLVLLTTLLFPLAQLGARARRDPRSFVAWLLLLETACLGSFVSLDLVFFFLFFELTLVPAYFIIGGWGYARRGYAAIKFFIYTFAGSAFLLVGILAIAFIHNSQTGVLTFELPALIHTHLSGTEGVLLFLAFTAAFAVKAPIFPFHTWSPDAYAEAPTAGAVLLAAVMAKLGTYGIVRFDLNLFPQATRTLAPWLLTLAVIGILYGALVACAQRDMKRLLAYSSLAQIGFIVLGTFALNSQGLTGGVLQMVNHGLIIATLFILVGWIYERRGTWQVSSLKGLQASAPVMAAVFTVAMLASIGVPGLNGFVGEFLVLIGTFLVHRWWAVLAAMGIIVAAVYLLWAYQQVFHGEPTPVDAKTRDLGWSERLIVAPLIILIVALGVFPKPVLDRITPSVNQLVIHVDRVTNTPVPAGLDAGPGSVVTPRHRSLALAGTRQLTTVAEPSPVPGEGAVTGVSLLVATSTPTIHTPHVDYLSILPMLIMMGGALVLMTVSSLFRRVLGVGTGTLVASAVSIAALVAALFQWDQVSTHGPQVTIAGAIAFDGFDVFIQIVVSIAMLLTALVGDGYLKREGVEGPEFHVLAMMSASGAMMMGAANDLIVVFLGLEIMSIALYVLAAFNHKRTESGEAALKYFVLGAFSSAVFVYGIALVYGATGSTNLPQIADYLSKNVIVSNGVLLAGLALLLVGFGFKIAAVPFHMWSPDVYQGSPSPVTGFMAAVAKAGAFAALLRVFVSSFGTVRTDWQPVVWGIAALSLVLGAAVALVQKDVKRMMAYSSINHAGFILLGVEAATSRGVSASLYYIFTYMFMVIGSFGVITVMSGDGDTGNQLADYRGLAKRQPVLAASLAVLLLGQAGVPFTTGFLAKFEVVGASVDTHAYVLATVAMVSAAVAAFFYLRVAVTMYSPVGPVGDLAADPEGVAPSGSEAVPADDDAGSSQPDGPSAVDAGSLEPVASLSVLTDAPPEESVTERGVVPVPSLTRVAIGLSVAFTVVFGIIPGPILDFAHQATLLFT